MHFQFFTWNLVLLTISVLDIVTATKNDQFWNAEVRMTWLLGSMGTAIIFMDARKIGYFFAAIVYFVTFPSNT